MLKIFVYNLELLIHTALLLLLNTFEVILRRSGICRLFGVIGLVASLKLQGLIKKYANYMGKIEITKANLWSAFFTGKLKFPSGFKEYEHIQDKHYRKKDNKDGQ